MVQHWSRGLACIIKFGGLLGFVEVMQALHNAVNQVLCQIDSKCDLLHHMLRATMCMQINRLGLMVHQHRCPWLSSI